MICPLCTEEQPQYAVVRIGVIVQAERIHRSKQVSLCRECYLIFRDTNIPFTGNIFKPFKLSEDSDESS